MKPKELPKDNRRVLVCGDRKWDDYTLIYDTLNKVGRIGLIIQGGARGADTHAKEWAQYYPKPFLHFPANWKKYGKAAGPIRNTQMLREGKPDLVIAFHDNIKKSKGTADMVRQARKASIPCVIVSHKGTEGDVEL